MNKAYNKITWQNKPSTATPLNQTNLNEMSNALDTIDDRVIVLDSDKVSKEAGKGLSSNDYTTAEKTKLAGIATGATAVSISDTLQDGDTIANITIDGTPTAIKAKQPNEQEMNVRSAMMLLSPSPIAENAPFVKRISGGNVPFPALLKDKIIGASVVWNQLVKNGNFVDTSIWVANGCTVSVSDNVLTATPSADNSRIEQPNFTILKGHKYMISAQFKCASGKAKIAWYGAGIAETNMNGSFVTVQTIYNNTYDDNTNWKVYYAVDGNTNRDTWQIKNAYITDLTAMFGSTIADYVYTLESGTAGSGIAWLKSYGFFLKDYYANSANTIQSVSVSGKKNVGKNLFNPELLKDQAAWNTFYIDLPNGTYTVSSNIPQSNAVDLPLYANTNYNPGAGTWVYSGHSVTVTVTDSTPFRIQQRRASGTDSFQNYEWQIEIGSTATPYEPYKEWQTSLDHTTLRGLLKLDANNNLYADGDIYPSSGNGSVKYALVDLGDLDWTYYTGGTNPIFIASITGVKVYASDILPNSICDTYTVGYGCKTRSELAALLPDKTFSQIVTYGNIVIRDSAYTDATTFTNAVKNKKLIFELATPTTATLTPYPELQNIASGGTEEFIDYQVSQGNRDVSVPVGGERQYYQGMDLPALPTASGNHNLQFNPSSGFSWS